MYENIVQLIQDAQVYKTMYSEDSDGPIFWLLGPVSAVAFYSMIYLRYRNTDKRHAYETKTVSEMGKVTAFDELSGRVKGVENARIPGENSSSPRTRLGQKSTFQESWRE